MSPRRRLVATLACLGLALGLTPLALGEGLRQAADRRLVAIGWRLDYQALTSLSLAAALAQSGDRVRLAAELDRLWPALTAWPDRHPAPQWLELARLEAAAGRPQRGRAALAQARARDPGVTALARDAAFAPWRADLGLDEPRPAAKP
ncbi:MAG: hypothetical protein ACOZHQ_05540 [Thermodesulfobacteriota bacterium]